MKKQAKKDWGPWGFEGPFKPQFPPTTPKSYFVKMLPVAGEESGKRSGTTTYYGQPISPNAREFLGKCIREDVGWDMYETLKLFLCSRDDPHWAQEILTEGIEEGKEFTEKTKDYLTLGSVIEI